MKQLNIAWGWSLGKVRSTPKGVHLNLLENVEHRRSYGLAHDSVIVEALKVDSLERLTSSLEPLFRKIVSEEVERALTRYGHGQIAARSSPARIQSSEGKILQLQFRTRMPPHLFTGGKVEGEQGAAIHVVLLDATTGNVVHTGPDSATKLNVVVLVLGYVHIINKYTARNM
ncbi:calmodulin-binding protein 60 E-like protein [Tanacetum coccineum]